MECRSHRPPAARRCLRFGSLRRAPRTRNRRAPPAATAVRRRPEVHRRLDASSFSCTSCGCRSDQPDFLAGALRAAALRAGAFLAAVFFAAAFLAGAFLAAAFLAGAFLAAAFLAGAFLAAAFLAGAFFATVFFAADAFLATVFFAA